MTFDHCNNLCDKLSQKGEKNPYIGIGKANAHTLDTVYRYFIHPMQMHSLLNKFWLIIIIISPDH